MASELIVPKLGMAVAVATLTEWKAREGERIEKGDNVLDIEAEKSAFEMTAPVSGWLHILVEQGVEVDVNSVVALIAQDEAEYAALAGTGASEAAVAAPEAPVPVQPAPPPPQAGEGDRLFATPIARRMAAENGLDLASITGTGPRGRVQRDDVKRAIAASRDAIPAPTAPTAYAAATAHPGLTAGRVLPYAGMRKAIGENMMRSLAINAPNTMAGEFDVTVLARHRLALVREEARLGTRITWANLLIQAVAQALRRFPLMNSSLIGGEIRMWDQVNVGMAVAIGSDGTGGLVVPVIRGADKLSLVELSQAVTDLGARAREGRLGAAEMTGGTFTVSNFGSLGVSSFSTPIINPPESGIIGIGRLTEKPIVRNGGIVVAPMLPWSLTHDHRVIDGAAAERFLSILKEIIENPGDDPHGLLNG